MHHISISAIILSFINCSTLYNPVNLSKITFLIPDYRDIKCSYTLHNIYTKAFNPDRVFVSLVQERYSEDPHCVYDLQESPIITEEEKKWIINNIRFITKHAKDAVGLHLNVYQAELLTQNLQEEDDENSFVIKIDSHSDFLLNYDSILVELFNRIGDDMAVISSYPLGTEFIPELGFTENVPKVYGKMCIMKQNPQGLLYLPIELTDWTSNYSCFTEPGYCRGFFVPGGFHFAKAHLIKNVPYDRYLSYFFNGEQFLFSARLYTHGYNVYTPALNFIFHVYGNGWQTRMKFEAEKKHDDFVYGKSLARYKKLLGIKIGEYSNEYEDSEYYEEEAELREIERFGMGDERTLDEFYRMIDIDQNYEYYRDEEMDKHGVFNACKALDKVNGRY